MNKWINIGISLLLIGSLIGCNEKPKADSKQTTTITKPAPIPEVKSDEYGEFDMTVPGQVYERPDRSKITLVSYKKVDQTFEISPIQITVDKIRIVRWHNVSGDDKTEIALASKVKNIPDEFHTIEIPYYTNNSLDKNVKFNGLKKIIIDTGEEINVDPPDDNRAHGSGFELERNFYIQSDPAKIKKIKLVFSSTIDGSTNKTITPEKEVEYTF